MSTPQEWRRPAPPPCTTWRRGRSSLPESPYPKAPHLRTAKVGALVMRIFGARSAAARPSQSLNLASPQSTLICVFSESTELIVRLDVWVFSYPLELILKLNTYIFCCLLQLCTNLFSRKGLVNAMNEHAKRACLIEAQPQRRDALNRQRSPLPPKTLFCCTQPQETQYVRSFLPRTIP